MPLCHRPAWVRLHVVPVLQAASRGIVSHHDFPNAGVLFYPGTVHHRDDKLDFLFEGRAGRHEGDPKGLLLELLHTFDYAH